MEILFHSHHATISPNLQQRAERGLRKLEQQVGRVVDATVRFEEDGPTRRVEIVLHLPRSRRLVAVGEARFFGPALANGLARIATQVRHERRAAKARRARGKRLARA